MHVNTIAFANIKSTNHSEKIDSPNLIATKYSSCTVVVSTGWLPLRVPACSLLQWAGQGIWDVQFLHSMFLLYTVRRTEGFAELKGC